jgi:hypothetical protein
MILEKLQRYLQILNELWYIRLRELHLDLKCRINDYDANYDYIPRNLSIMILPDNYNRVDIPTQSLVEFSDSHVKWL